MYDARLRSSADKGWLVSVSQALFGYRSAYLQSHFMSAVESLERKSDVELRDLLGDLAGFGDRELLLEVVASSRKQEVFTRKWCDDVFMVFGFTGDVHGAQLWQQSSPCFAGVEGAESAGCKLHGTSVLQIASGHGRVDMVQWLLEQKADVDASRMEPHPQPGRNALHDAANFRCWETCALLLQHSTRQRQGLSR